jgi:UDPglucose 6-dehydrogenase
MIVGCGYVGLTMAGFLLQGGHTVTCFDTDAEKINRLGRHEMYIYEPHLEELLSNPLTRTRISFTTYLNQIDDIELIYLCIGTPPHADGTSDLSFLYQGFYDIVNACQHRAKPCTVCIKSTLPPGTTRTLQDYLCATKNTHIQIVYNPEFMREGSAIRDIYNNPIILGSDSIDARENIESMYQDLLHPDIKAIKTTFETAEIIKYSWNSFSAIRIAYINELAEICKIYGADITSVIEGFSLSEELLPTKHIKPGPGYGGSCFPKDTSAFSKILEHHGISPSLVHQAMVSNKNHQSRLINDIIDLLQPVERGSITEQKKIVAILGLAFKAHTNDIRNAPAIEIIKALSTQDVSINAYDPQATRAMKELFPHLSYFDSPYEAVRNADLIIVLTEWPEIKNLDLDRISLLCNKRVIVDTKNLYDPVLLKKYQFTYLNMGRCHENYL